MAEDLALDIRHVNLRIVSGKTHGRDLGGMIINSRHTEPYWTAEFTTPPLSRADRIAVLGDLDRWVDENIRLDFVHPLFMYPEGYDASTWPLATDPELESVVDLRTIEVSGLGVGMVLPRYTRLTLIQSDGSVCYRRIRTAVTVASALSQQIEVTPRLPPGVFSNGATVRLEEPFVRLMIVPESYDSDDDIESEPLTFSAEETLR